MAEHALTAASFHGSLLDYCPPLTIQLCRRQCIKVDSARFQEAKLLSDLTYEHVSPFYPETESDFGRTLLLNSLSANRFDSSAGSRVWSISSDERCIGFFAATYKHRLSIKLGPIVLVPFMRGRGIGRAVIGALERFYAAQGITTLYMTMPASNTRALRFASSAGFLPITLMRRHYSCRWDEISLAKAIHNRSQERLSSGTMRRPAASITSIDEEDVGSPNLDIDYRLRPYLRFSAEGRRQSQAVLDAFLKRGGAVKLVAMNAPSDDLYIATIDIAENQLRLLDRRKLYTELPQWRGDVIGLLLARGFVIEGKYGLGRQSYLLAKALR